MEAYLEGVTNWKLRRLPDAMRLFRQAVTLDPGMAAAWGTLAACYAVGGGGQSRAETMRNGKEAAENAIRLDPGLPEGRSALGWILTYYDWDWAGAEKEFRTAIEVNPSYAQAYHAYSHYLVILGRSGEAEHQIQRARSLDPFEPAIAGHMTWHYYMKRDYPRALEEARRTLEVDPDNQLAPGYRRRVYIQLGRYEDAMADAKMLGNRHADAEVLAAQGRRAEALKLLEGLLPTANLHNRRRMILEIYAALGDREKTFEWLDKALEERSYALPDNRVDPAYDAYRGDPRFGRALERMGLPPF